jgi:hypothetical protein
MSANTADVNNHFTGDYLTKATASRISSSPEQPFFTDSLGHIIKVLTSRAMQFQYVGV